MIGGISEKLGKTRMSWRQEEYRACRWCIVVLLLALPAPLQAQTAAPATEKVDRLIELLSDPEVKTWLADQNKKTALATQPASNDVPTLSDILRSIRSHVLETLAA